MESIFRKVVLHRKYHNQQKSSHAFFCVSSTVSDILTFHIFYLKKLGQDHKVHFFSMMPFDGKRHIYILE